MITGLRNEWEPWKQMEVRNRKDLEAGIRHACREARADVNLVVLEEKMMAFFAGEVERFLEATAKSCGGTVEDLRYCIANNKITWRERNIGRIEAQCFGQISAVNYARSSTPPELISLPPIAAQRAA